MMRFAHCQFKYRTLEASLARLLRKPVKMTGWKGKNKKEFTKTFINHGFYNKCASRGRED